MRNEEKDLLRSMVKNHIAMGHSVSVTVKALRRLAYCDGTIRTYYKAFAPRPPLQEPVERPKEIA